VNRETNMHCIEREEQIFLLACGELENEAAAELDTHFSACTACAEAFEQQKQLHEAYLLNAGAEPSPAFMAECRTRLEAAMDQASQPGFLARVWAGLAKGEWKFGYRNWLAAHPALGAAAFILVGVLVGNLAPRWLEESRHPGAFVYQGEPPPAMVVNSGDVSGRMGVRGISLSPSAVPGQGVIVVQGVRETPMRLIGTSEDPAIRQALLEILPNGQDFSLDTRMMALEMLRPRSGHDTEVRDSLCKTARNDSNPSVRLKALEALRGMEQDNTVRLTLTQVLLKDTNPGVRIEAINSLRALAEMQNAPVDQHTVDVLRERMEKDPNTYIRVQSAAAMRQLAQRGVY